MKISYKPLWKLLIDRDLKKKDLCRISGISTASVTKMGKGGHVTTEVLAKICDALHVAIDQIMEITTEE
jgi:DNA-binding Xre family transcriptional regulator